MASSVPVGAGRVDNWGKPLELRAILDVLQSRPLVAANAIFDPKYALSSKNLHELMTLFNLSHSQVGKNNPFPQPSTLPYYWIINLDKRPKGRGTHWTLLWTANAKQFFYMDSFGMQSDQLTKRFAGPPTSNSTRLQHELSVMCGWYVIHAAVNAGTTRSSFLTWLSKWSPSNTLHNEAILIRWIRNTFN